MNINSTVQKFRDLNGYKLWNTANVIILKNETEIYTYQDRYMMDKWHEGRYIDDNEFSKMKQNCERILVIYEDCSYEQVNWN